jgi:hypothetical protein
MPTTKRTARAKKKPVAPKTELKRKIGRPSKYDPSYCELVVDLGADGKSRTQIAVAIGVNRETLSEWAKVHPEFSAALKESKERELAWWENIGQQQMVRPIPGFSASAFIFQLKNRFRDDYRDVQHQHGEHKITQTQVPSELPVSQTLEWIDQVLGAHRDDNSAKARFLAELPAGVISAAQRATIHTSATKTQRSTK